MKVVGLFRVSTEKQQEHGSSLDAQERAYQEMAVREGWETVATYRGCESATQASSDRRVLQQVLGCLREQKVDAVWVYEQSRLTRGDQLEVLSLKRELTDTGVKVCVNGVFRDPASIDDGFMLAIQSLVDHTESRRIKERMGRGKRQRASQGRKNSGPSPYGYMNPPPGTTGRGTLQIVEDEAVVVRRIFKMCANGVGDRRIAETLNGLGIPSPRGRRWGKTTIRRALECPAYIGTQASGVWRPVNGTRYFKMDLDNPNAIVVEDAHPAIVSREVWDAVRARTTQPRAAQPRLLTGLLYVGDRRFGGDGSRGMAYYRSADRRPGGAWLDAKATDDRVWDAFAALATGDEFVQGLLEQARNPRQQQIVAMEIEHLEDRLGRLERRLTGLTDMRADGDIAKDEYRERSAKTRAEMETVGAELVEQRAKAVTFDGTHAARIVRAVQVLLAGRSRLTRDQKRRVLDSIVARIDLEAERVVNPQARDERGRVKPGRSVNWEIGKIEFRLVLPPDEAACGVLAGSGGAGPGRATRPHRATTTVSDSWSEHPWIVALWRLRFRFPASLPSPSCRRERRAWRLPA